MKKAFLLIFIFFTSVVLSQEINDNSNVPENALLGVADNTNELNKKQDSIQKNKKTELPTPKPLRIEIINKPNSIKNNDNENTPLPKLKSKKKDN